MNSFKNSVLFSKLKCPFCGKKLTYLDIDLDLDDVVIIHTNSSNGSCKRYFPIIDGIIILSDYKFWPKKQFSNFLQRNNDKLPVIYLNYFHNIQNMIKEKDYKFNNNIEKMRYRFIKFQQDHQEQQYINCNSNSSYFSKLITENKINRFVDEHKKLKHCLNHKFYSGEWILTICSADGKDVLVLNKYLLTKDICLNNVLTDISFYALLEAKKNFRFFSSYFILSDSQDPPFFDNSFDICYVHAGIHRCGSTPRGPAGIARHRGACVVLRRRRRTRLGGGRRGPGALHGHENLGGALFAVRTRRCVVSGDQRRRTTGHRHRSP